MIKSILFLSWIFISTFNSWLIVSEVKQDNSFVLQAWWDIMLSRWIWYSLKQWKTPFIGTTKEVHNPIKYCDKCFLFFNLESLFSDNPNDSPQSSFSFRTNLKNLSFIKNLLSWNVSYLSINNNHTNNVSSKWVELTKKVLKENWIQYWIEWWQKIIIKNNTVCLGSYSYDWWQKKGYYQNTLEDTIIHLKEMVWQCDYKIISIHWWREYKFNPTKEQESLAYKIIDNGADLILWHHSHVPWKIEKYNWKYIFYSLWNFLFDQDWWYKTCDNKYDSIKENWKCVTPTHIWIMPEFMFSWWFITLNNVDVFGVKKWTHYKVDEITKNNLFEKINFINK